LLGVTSFLNCKGIIIRSRLSGLSWLTWSMASLSKCDGSDKRQRLGQGCDHAELSLQTCVGGCIIIERLNADSLCYLLISIKSGPSFHVNPSGLFPPLDGHPTYHIFSHPPHTCLAPGPLPSQRCYLTWASSSFSASLPRLAFSYLMTWPVRLLLLSLERHRHTCSYIRLGDTC
jgi:hypothetical protein